YNNRFTGDVGATWPGEARPGAARPNAARPLHNGMQSGEADMAIKVFIDGAAGTTGLQIRDRMAAETQFEVVQLEGEDRKSPEARARALNSADFAILCLPDAAAREAVQMIDSDVRVIDASSAHRTSKEWVYGLPELSTEQAEAIR